MPVQPCTEDGQNGFRWGDTGKCYTYTPGDDASRERARQQAAAQGQAVKARQGSEAEQVDIDLSNYEPTDEELEALMQALMDVLDMSEARVGEQGGIGSIIGSFGGWAGGSHSQCVSVLSGKAGISDPARLCAWLKDRHLRHTRWRGKSEAALGNIDSGKARKVLRYLESKHG